MALQFNFGANGVNEPTWNNVPAGLGYVGNPDTISNLVDTSDNPTSYSLTVTSIANGPNFSGTTSSTLFPAFATEFNIFGNTPEAGNGIANVTPVYELKGLETDVAYDFLFYASRAGVSDNRETTYRLTGTTVEAVDLNPSNNIDTFVTIENVFPDEFGTFQIEVLPGPNNDNSFTFTYLGVLQVTQVPEPETYGLIAGAVIGLAVAVRRRRSAKA